MNARAKLAQSILSKIWVIFLAVALADYLRHDDTLFFNIISFTLAGIACLWFAVNLKNGRRLWAFIAAGFVFYFAVNYALRMAGAISQETLSLRLRPASNGFAWLPVWYLYVFQPIENKLAEVAEKHKRMRAESANKASRDDR